MARIDGLTRIFNWSRMRQPLEDALKLIFRCAECQNPRFVTYCLT